MALLPLDEGEEVDWNRFLSELAPGSLVLVYYEDDDVYHERYILWALGNDEFVILTPDFDRYVESYAVRGGDITDLVLLPRSRRLPSGLGARAYRFAEYLEHDELRKQIRGAFADGRAHLGVDPPLPVYAVNQEGNKIAFDDFFGGHFLARRVARKGAQRALPPSTGGPLPLGHDGKEESEDDAAGTGGRPEPIGLGSAKKGRPWIKLMEAMAPLAALPAGSALMANEKIHDINVGEKVPHKYLVAQLGSESALVCIGDEYFKCSIVPESQWETYRKLKLPDPATPRGNEPDSPGNDGAQKEADDEDEIWTLWVDTDEQGDQYKEWRVVCRECFEAPIQHKVLEGPYTMMHWIKHVHRHGGDPRLWLMLWMKAKGVEVTDRIYHEMKVLIDILFYAGTHDQLNLPNLTCLEVAVRRVQAITEAYSNPSRPDWSDARLFTGQGSPEDCVSPQFRSYAVKKKKDELELLQARNKNRELRNGPLNAQAEDGAAEAGEDNADAGPRGRGRGRGRGGRK